MLGIWLNLFYLILPLFARGFLNFFHNCVKKIYFDEKNFFCKIDKSVYLYYNILCININSERKNTEMKFINIGFGNMVAASRMVALVSPDSAPVKRLIQDAKDEGRTIDVTCGRRTRAVIITDSEHVILSAIQAETIANRLEDESIGDDEEAEDEE